MSMIPERDHTIAHVIRFHMDDQTICGRRLRALMSGRRSSFRRTLDNGEVAIYSGKTMPRGFHLCTECTKSKVVK